MVTMLILMTKTYFLNSSAFINSVKSPLCEINPISVPILLLKWLAQGTQAVNERGGTQTQGIPTPEPGSQPLHSRPLSCSEPFSGFRSTHGVKPQKHLIPAEGHML